MHERAVGRLVRPRIDQAVSAQRKDAGHPSRLAAVLGRAQPAKATNRVVRTVRHKRRLGRAVLALAGLALLGLLLLAVVVLLARACHVDKKRARQAARRAPQGHALGQRIGTLVRRRWVEHIGRAATAAQRRAQQQHRAKAQPRGCTRPGDRGSAARWGASKGVVHDRVPSGSKEYHGRRSCCSPWPQRCRPLGNGRQTAAGSRKPKRARLGVPAASAQQDLAAVHRGVAIGGQIDIGPQELGTAYRELGVVVVVEADGYLAVVHVHVGPVVTQGRP